MMTSQEILQAFQAGKISLEEAKKALTSIETSQAPVPDTLNVACGLAPQAVQPSFPTQSPDQSDTHGQVASVRMPVMQGTQARQGLSLSAAASQVLPVPGEHLQASELGASKAGQDSHYSTERKEAIAIVGMSGKYPGARNLTEYWDNLVQGKNAIREIPLTRFDVSHYYDPTTPAQRGKISCKWLGALDEIEYFDPLFFHLSPAEAERMDPQQRLFLEEGYKAFEDAGYSAQLLSNRKCGVYLGIMSHEYDLLLHQHEASEMSLLGGSFAIAAARIAYLLNLKGPAIAIDTACSSSLVATHLACQALSNQEIDMALVGGVSLYLTPGSYIGMCSAGMLSPDGQCKTFDASANGFVPGEGVGALVLKRLADAEADHDQIYGVIIGSGMNQDGTTNGITAPSVNSQMELERGIYEKYQIDPASISYVEMHGTGTKLGDPIELEALATVFQEKTQRRQYCGIGSVKSNIGHTSAAAGVAGLQKVLLAMKEKKLVPSLHFQQPNERFDFEASPFYVNIQVQDWQSEGGTPLRAAVSAFGFSGTNAHVVIEEYITEREADEGNPHPYGPLPRGLQTPCLFVLSARSESQLKSYVQEMKVWIQAHEELALTDIAFTLQVGRSAMEYRLAIVASSREVLLQRLEAFVNEQASAGIYTAQVEKKPTSDASLFEADADGQSLLHIWCQKKNIEKIAQIWVRGVNVDWMLLYTVGEGSAQGMTIGASPMATAALALPYRTSLPTYPFVRKRYWLPIGASPTIGASPMATTKVELTSRSTPASPRGAVHLRSLGVSPFSIARPEAEASSLVTQDIQATQGQTLSATDETNGNAKALTISQSRSDDVVAPGRGPVGSRFAPDSTLQAPRDIGESLSEKLHTPMQTAGSVVESGLATRLEGELVKSLAKALYIEESDIGVEEPFEKIGLDSIIGVEWIRSLNEQYAINLAATRIYDYPSIRQMAAFLQKELSKQQRTPVQSRSTLSASTYQCVVVERPGGIDDLIIAEADMLELGEHEVRIVVRAFSLNFGDLLCAKGLYPTMPPYPFTPGFDASGIVLEVGRAVTAFQPDDPVIAIAGPLLGGQATVMTCPEDHVFHKPAQLSFEDACALPAVAITMIAAFEKALLKRGEKILIQTATGGTGLIAIQLANHYGAQIYATAGSQPKLDYLKQLGVPHRINYQETDFEQEIERLTEGKGVDVVINTLSGDAIQKGMNCLASGGRYIEIAMTALKSARTIDLSVLSHNQTFYSVDLRKLAQTDPATLKHYCHKMFQLVEEGIITPTICQVFDWERLKEAYRYMENRQHIGKIVVRIPETNQTSQQAISQRVSAVGVVPCATGLPHPSIKYVSLGIVPEDRSADLVSPTPTLGRKEAIAIVGMSGKYPDARNLTDFWDNLVQGKNAIREIPRSRFDVSDYYDPNPVASEKISCKWLGALDEIEYFDPLFFHLSPAEAKGMDPQHRLFLEEGYKAFEDAGYSPGLLSNRKCGVYLGIVSHEYGLLLSEHKASETDLFGTSSAIAAARIAYLLNLKGPAIAIDTACSSSLVAMHLACQALRNQEIDMALVGGVSLCLAPGFYMRLCNAGMLSPDGQCKTFDASANGFVPGEGVGAVVLKRLADAEADHDQIYGVIIGSGMNQDGATNGIAAPSVKSQIELERDIYEKYQIDPESISYVEMHGTGTKLGDPIELEALSTVFQEKTQRKKYCAIGSVKSNIGHTLTVAGLAGVQKVLLAMKQKKLVPTLHFEQPNEHFDFEASPFYVNTEVQDWKSEAGRPLRAAVSSFGFSGTNAHLVVEEYLPAEEEADCKDADGSRRNADGDRRDGACPRPSTQAPVLFVLSAKSEQQLKSYAQEMKRWIQAHEEQALEDIAFTLQLGREAMDYRLAIVANSREVLLQRLEVFVNNQTSTGVHTGQVGKGTTDALLFEDDEDGQSLLHIWCQKKNIKKIAQIWVRGVNVDWILFYTVGAGSEPRTIPTAPVLPHRISLPTYPFARKRYWVSLPQVELTSSSTFPSPTVIAHLPSSGVPALSIAQHLAVISNPQPEVEAVGTCRGEGQAADPTSLPACASPAPTKRVALRPLADHPTCSKDGANQSQPSTSLSGSVQSFSQSGSNDDAILRESPMVTTNMQAALFVDSGTSPQLEEELARSLAKALYMEESDIDVEKPFGVIGLDSIISVEWVKSLNKQYASNLKASCVYDYPTIRQLAGFLDKHLLKHSEGIRQTSVQSMSILSLEGDEAVGLGRTGASHVPTAPSPCACSPLQRQDVVLVGNSEYLSSDFTSPAPVLGRKKAIAIVGMSGKYPAARNLTEYWDNLAQGKNAIREVPLSRFDVSGYYDPNPAALGKISCKWLGALDEIDCFDPLFFHLSPAEAEVMDPQQRLFLEEGYKAFEDAGYSPGLLSNRKCGVYLGMMSHEYDLLLSQQKASEMNLLGNSSAIAAARIAYHLNLKGPALAVDTACSSSLVATHLACQALRHQEIDMALVGGVSLYLTPDSYVGMCSAGMLSPDGQCKTFDASANGFVPGEGVGALVLKRLEDAEADHDQIYGVIIGSGMNQDGATNGITAPSVKSQIELEHEIYEKYQIHPESISYVEMHGTGTKLGDPIELEALATVFQEKTQRNQYCAIGSVKSNIGHTSAAAGVAGLQKVLLAMKQKKLVPTLHFLQPNEHFDFETSPFYVNTEVRDWESVEGTPLRAAVSSFGYSGTNAHLVVEEYIPAREANGSRRNGEEGRRDGACPRSETPILFVLSARSERQLKSYAQEMQRWIQAHEELALENIAFTLQLGREAMDYRLAMIADSREVLLQRLEGFVDNQAPTRVHTAQVKKGTTDTVLFEADQDAQSLLHIWCQKKNLEKIARVWVKGVNVDWKLLYTIGAGAAQDTIVQSAPTLPHRISLPTYPFARERYWIPTTSLSPTTFGAIAQATTSATLHPLVQRNTSTLWEQRFSSTFRGDEFFLADHVISGQRIMPGVAYLEMARAAVREALGVEASHEPSRLHLSHVMWTHPLAVGEQPVTVHITLSPQESGTLSFLISRACVPCATEGGIPQEEECTEVVYCQGIAELREKAVRSTESQNLDLPAVQARCPHQISGSSCYQRYRELSLNYGPAYQGIEQLNVGEGEVLARFRLPSVVAQTQTEGGKPLPYVLHPSVLDAALHASIGLLIEQNAHQVLQVPFALSALSIEGSVPTQGWTWIRRSPQSMRTVAVGSDPVPTLVLDIDVCDDAGRVAVRLRGLSARPFVSRLESLQTRLLTPDWKEEAIAGQASPEDPAPNLTQALAQVASNPLVLLCGLPDLSASGIEAQMTSGGHCRGLKVKNGHSAHLRRDLRFQDVVVQLIQELQYLLRSQPAGPALVQVVVAHREEPSLQEALVGVLKVAQQEHPQLRGQLIEVEGKPEEGELLVWLRENQLRAQEPHVRYRNGKRWVREWQEYPQISAPVTTPWKEGGCYLITGGAGGLARLFVEEIARQVQEATVILVGRSALSAEQRAQLTPRVEGHSICIDYQQVDVSDGSAVHALIQGVLTKYGQLNGIIHAAGVLRNTRFFDKTQEEVRAVLAPKVIGVEQLDEASRQIPLDFFMLCSSLSAVLGGVGFVDYAAANAYLDAFAHARRAKVLSGERQGATLSINWPYWEEGGMQTDASTLQMMRELLGEEPMGTETGMKTLYQALALGSAQVVVLHGQVERIKEQLLQIPKPSVGVGFASTLPVESVTDAGHEGRQTQGAVPTDKLREALTYMVSDLLKVRVERINAKTPLSEYGFDSITFVKFANRLNQTYQLDLTAPIFFEYSTIERLVQYLQATYAAVLASHFAVVSTEMMTRQVAPGSVTTDKVSPIGAIGTVPPRRHSRVARPLVYMPEQRAPAGAEPIAITGMSGVFPQSPDVQSLWSNLLEGRDCIGEIPPERWDWPTSLGNSVTSNPEKANIKWAGVIEGVETFDPLFFGISPSEAEQMDPQQRLLMMYVWKAIEDAGYSAESLSGTDTALFVGTASSGYSERALRAVEGYSYTGLLTSTGPNRMSYFLNLHGPSEPIETASSSSLVAIHRGVNAIESGQCAMAIVGGINTLISPEAHISFSKAGILCEDGRCKPFSAEANGYVRGEGVGMLVLKKLSAAEQAGDHIYGVIRATAENHGGRSNSLTAPNPRAQADLLIAAYRKAGIDPRTVGYIEAHGTGTPLGDPIEINGLKTAFGELAQIIGEGPMPQESCGIGSLKSNIGHLELASGVAGVIKVLLQMQHKKLVKTLHCEQINPYIQLESSPFYIVQENREWEVLRDRMGNALPRRAGVSSFGFGGVNAHVVLEEYAPKPRATLPESLTQLPSAGQASGWGQAPPPLVVLSARNEERLQEQVRQLLAWVQAGMWTGASPVPVAPEQKLQDLAYTLQVGREAMEERLALQVSSLAELEEKLGRYLCDSVQEGGDWYRGQVKQYKEMVGLLSIDEELQEVIGKWIQRGKYEKLLQWWVKGGTIDWRYLYGGYLPRRISLPTYPFARERYWVSTPKFGPTF